MKGYSAEAISKLRQESGGDILINGSAQLVHALTNDDLVDEYRLMGREAARTAGRLCGRHQRSRGLCRGIGRGGRQGPGQP